MRLIRGHGKGGTLYPLLNRLESAELVTVEWRAGDGGPGRKYYWLTDEGHRVLQSTATQWSLFTEVTQGVIAGSLVVQQGMVRNAAEVCHELDC